MEIEQRTGSLGVADAYIGGNGSVLSLIHHSLIFVQNITSPLSVTPSKVVYVLLGRNDGMSLENESVEVPARSGQSCCEQSGPDSLYTFIPKASTDTFRVPPVMSTSWSPVILNAASVPALTGSGETVTDVTSMRLASAQLLHETARALRGVRARNAATENEKEFFMMRSRPD